MMTFRQSNPSQIINNLTTAEILLRNRLNKADATPLTDGGDDLQFACEGAGIDAGMMCKWGQAMREQGWPRHRYEVWRQLARGM